MQSIQHKTEKISRPTLSMEDSSRVVELENVINLEEEQEEEVQNGHILDNNEIIDNGQCCSYITRGVKHELVRRKSWAEIRRRKEEGGDDECDVDNVDDDEDGGGFPSLPGQCCEVWPPPLWRKRRRSKVEVKVNRRGINQVNNEQQLETDDAINGAIKITAVVRIKGQFKMYFFPHIYNVRI